MAFEWLFNSYRNKVYGYAIKICQSSFEAEEIVQNVFMQVWINRSQLHKIKNFAGYIRIISRNEALQFLRRLAIENRHQMAVASEWIEQHNDTETTVYYKEAKNILDRTLDSLPPQQKLVYNLCHLQGMKQQEVAVKLHLSPLTVKAHLRQAVFKVRKAMHLEMTVVILFILYILKNNF